MGLRRQTTLSWGLGVAVLLSLVAGADAADWKFRPATKTRPKTKTTTTAPAPVPVNLSASQREALFQKLLARYCRVISSSKSTAPIPVRLGGWPALQVPSSSVMGLVLLGEGNTRRKGPYARQLDKLYKYVALTTGGPNLGASHESWPLAFAILFLSEVHRVEPSAALRTRITKLVKRLETGRNGEKGWYHSLKSANYGPFVGVTIWCVAALGSAREQGAGVDADGLATSLRGLEKSLGRSGGAFYFTRKRSSDVKPGRTGGVAWVLTRYGQTDRAKLIAARRFLIEHVEAAPKGHASWMMNMGWAALGAASADDKTREAFWAVHRKTILRTRAPGAFFRVQRWTETGFRDSRDSKPIGRGTSKTWPDPMYGDAWATVWMFLVWQAERGKSVLTARLKQTTTAPRSADTAAFDENDMLARIRKGQSVAVRKDIFALLKKHRGRADLYRLRAFTYVPALLDPFDASKRNFGAWSGTVGALALRDLSTALLRKKGKGDVSDEFNDNVRTLRARIYAKRTVAAYRPKSTAWVRPYNTFIREIRTILKLNPRNRQAVAILNAVKATVNIKQLKRPSKRRTSGIIIPLR
ncbi:MAG: hypothetical protein QGH60_00350 [Phycisphaerae bacterium]|jgi:hypothetical protein|nr:hypothetical protein [Phycisphaerae bacterium]